MLYLHNPNISVLLNNHLNYPKDITFRCFFEEYNRLEKSFEKKLQKSFRIIIIIIIIIIIKIQNTVFKDANIFLDYRKQKMTLKIEI